MRKSAARAVRSDRNNRNKQDVLARAISGATPRPFELLEDRRLFTIVQPAGQDYLAFEAEHAEAVFTDLADADTLTWERVSGDAAYGQITAPSGGGAIISRRSDGLATNDAGSASYPIQLRAAGPYSLYARVKYAGGGDNSMYVPADGGPINAPATQTFDNRTESLNNYHWVNLNADATPVAFDYTNPAVGAPTTLQLNVRENGYYVDRIVLSEVARTPTELDAITPTPLAIDVTTEWIQPNSAFITFSPVPGAFGGYNIYRSLTATGGYQLVGGPHFEPTFVDPGLEANTTYYYQATAIVDGVEGPRSNTEVITTGHGLIGHYYNNGFWGNGDGNGARPANPYSNATTERGGTVIVRTDGGFEVEYVPQVAYDWGTSSPMPPTIRDDNHSTVFTGKIIPNTTGAYQIAGFGDDDTHVYVDGVLVSSDPGGHGIPGTAAEIDFRRSLDLTAGVEYDIVVLQAEGGGGSGVFLRWDEPAAGETYVNVPSANLRQTTAPPTAPTAVARDAASTTGGVEIDFTDTSKNELRFQLQRSTDGSSWSNVNSRAGLAGINGTTVYDPTAVVGQTYQYRVVALNYDGQAESAPITVTVGAPVQAPGASAYYFNTQWWGTASAPTAYKVSVADVQSDFSETVPQISFNYGESSPRPGVIQGDNHSTVFTGKLRAPETGTYQILGFTDDDSYVYVNNQLVSADPGGHGIPGTVGEIDWRRPITLTAGQDYNFVVMQSEGGGGSGVILRWQTPSSSSLVDVPASAFVSNVPNAAPDQASGAPATPTGFAASEVGSTRAVISFNDVSANELRYILEKATNAAFTDAEQIRLPINSTSYVDPNLAGSTQYYYRLRAENYFGDSVTAPINFTTRADGTGEAPLATPTDVVARARSTGIVVSFVDRSSFEDGFIIQRKNAGGTFDEVGTLLPAAGSGNALSFEDTTVVGTPGTYTYRVIASSAAGAASSSPPSAEATAVFPPTGAGTGLTASYFNEMFFAGPVGFTTTADGEELWAGGSPDASIDPDTFSGVFEGYFQPDVTGAHTFQTASDDGISLRIFDPATGAALINFDNINTFRGISAPGTYQDFAGTATLTAGTKYPMQVRFNEGGGGADYRVGFSTATTPLQVIPVEMLYPALGTETTVAPTGLRQAPGFVGGEGIAVIFEETNLAETGYELQRSTDQTFATFTTINLAPDSTRYNEDPAGLTNGQTIYYRVRALGTGAPTAFSAPVAVTPRWDTAQPLTLNGSAVYMNGPDNIRGTADDFVRLTDNVNDQTGGFYSTDAFDISAPGQGPGGTEGFTANFDFIIPEFTADPADGFAFVIQRNNANQLQGGGGAIGYSGMPASVAVIFDTYDAANRNETYVVSNGENNDGGFPSGLVFASNTQFRVNLTYDRATNTLTQTITNVANPAQTFTKAYTTADGPGAEAPALNIPAIVGGEFAYVGFVGATGGLNEEVRISNFTFNGKTILPAPGGATATVSEVFVRGSTWAGQDNNPATVKFMEYLEAKGLGDDNYGYRLFGAGRTPPAGNTHDILPWINMNQLVVKYSSPPTGTGVPTPGSLTVNGVKGAYTITTVEAVPGDPTAFVLTLNKPLGGGNPATGVAPTAAENGDIITLGVPGGGAAGTAYSLKMNVLQGDTDHLNEGNDHVVLARDFSEVKKKFFKDTDDVPAGTDADYSPFFDVDASGSILAGDFSEVKKRFFQSLTLPAAAAVASLDGSSATSDLLGTATQIL